MCILRDHCMVGSFSLKDPDLRVWGDLWAQTPGKAEVRGPLLPAGERASVRITWWGMATDLTLGGRQPSPSSISMWGKHCCDPPTDTLDTPWALTDWFLCVLLGLPHDVAFFSFSCPTRQVFSLPRLPCEQGYTNKAKIKMLPGCSFLPTVILFASVQFLVLASEASKFCWAEKTVNQPVTLSQKN